MHKIAQEVAGYIQSTIETYERYGFYAPGSVPDHKLLSEVSLRASMREVARQKKIPFIVVEYAYILADGVFRARVLIPKKHPKISNVIASVLLISGVHHVPHKYTPGMEPGDGVTTVVTPTLYASTFTDAEMFDAYMSLFCTDAAFREALKCTGGTEVPKPWGDNIKKIQPKDSEMGNMVNLYGR